VLENLRLGSDWNTGRGGRIRWGRERVAARTALASVGLNAHPDVLVGDLGAVQRTQVAVARALQDRGRARVLFFDEPTATLPGSEVERLFAVIRSTVEQGIGVVYISHRLEELPQIADRITVLRDGRVVGSGPMSEFRRDRLVEMIVGGSIQAAARTAGPARDGASGYLQFDEVYGGELNGASFAVAPGEIVGMAGLVGSGVHDIPAVLLGRVPLERGSIHVAGADLPDLSPHRLIARKIAVLPSARPLRAILTLTVRENLTLPDLGRSGGGVGFGCARSGGWRSS